MNRQFFIVLLFVILSTFLFGQKKQEQGAFGQKINIKEYAGKNFILEANLKLNRIENNAFISIFATIYNSKKEQVFFQNSASAQSFILFNKWRKSSISGNIPDNADDILIGVTFGNKGIFYCDDFKLLVENSDGTFESIKIQNSSFENDKILSNDSWDYFAKIPEYRFIVDNSTFTTGVQSLQISNSNFKKENLIGDNDSTGKYVTVNSIDLYYETYGNGEPLILLHGNSESISAFQNQIPELSKYFKVITIDTRGQGKTSEDGKKYSYDLFAEDLKLFLDYLKLDSVNILGWSDGGNTGLITALKYPQKVKKLITMGANIFVNETAVNNKILKTLKKQVAGLSKAKSYYSQNSSRLKTLLLTEPNHTFEELNQIQVPVLVIAGENDIIKAEHTKGIASHINKSILTIAKNETHEFPAENPKLFNQLVLNFLRAK
jgi:pimeloyl-ACP methyl ester carboxylesterase